MPRRLYIAEQFDSYRREVIPANAPMVQVEECRRAFYAGTAALIGILRESPDNPSEERRFMLDLEAELKDFPNRVVKLNS